MSNIQFHYGQVLESKEDMTLETALLHRKVDIKKGSKVIIGGDGFAHHFSGDLLQPLPKDAEVSGFSGKGLAHWIVHTLLRSGFPLREILEDYEIDREDLEAEIAEALWDIGFCADDQEEDEDSESEEGDEE